MEKLEYDYPWWDLAVDAIKTKIEDGDISYCAAIDLLDDVHGLPAMVHRKLVKEWTEKGCPDVTRKYANPDNS